MASSREQSTRSLGSHTGRNAVEIRRKVSIHFSVDQDTVDTIYRIILSVNQLSVCFLCDEDENHQDRTATRYIGGTVNCSWRNQSRSSCS